MSTQARIEIHRASITVVILIVTLIIIIVVVVVVVIIIIFISSSSSSSSSSTTSTSSTAAVSWWKDSGAFFIPTAALDFLHPLCTPWHSLAVCFKGAWQAASAFRVAHHTVPPWFLKMFVPWSALASSGIKDLETKICCRFLACLCRTHRINVRWKIHHLNMFSNHLASKTSDLSVKDPHLNCTLSLPMCCVWTSNK